MTRTFYPGLSLCAQHCAYHIKKIERDGRASTICGRHAHGGSAETGRTDGLRSKQRAAKKGRRLGGGGDGVQLHMTVDIAAKSTPNR